MECSKCGQRVSNREVDIHEQGCLVMECSHCGKRFSSTLIDDHEHKCAEDLSASATKKLMGIPETKGSTHKNALIHKVDSDQDFGDVGTPERSQVVHQQPVSGRPSQPGSPQQQIRPQNGMSLLKKHVSQQQPKGNAGLSMLNSATHEREKKILYARQARMERENDK